MTKAAVGVGMTVWYIRIQTDSTYDTKASSAPLTSSSKALLATKPSNSMAHRQDGPCSIHLALDARPACPTRLRSCLVPESTQRAVNSSWVILTLVTGRGYYAFWIKVAPSGLSCTQKVMVCNSNIQWMSKLSGHWKQSILTSPPPPR